MTANPKCPQCGSENTDMPRAYGPEMRLSYCCRICKDCGHEGTRHPTIEAAHSDPEWRDGRGLIHTAAQLTTPENPHG